MRLHPFFARSFRCSALLRFLSLDSSKQKELAKQIGSSADVIIDNLLQIELSSSFF